jgi:putative spermidine/putrescine transport system permease protein
MELPPHASALERVTAVSIRALTGIALSYLVLPILVIVPLSFTAGEVLVYPVPGWSLRWYEELATDASWTRAAWTSVLLAVATTLIATAIGTLAAFGLHGLRGRLRLLVFGVLGLPIIVPTIIAAVALYNFYATLHLVGTFGALALAHGVLAIPFVAFTVSATLQGLDPGLPRAAASLGATPLQAFVRVTLPIIRPGLASGAILAFVTSFDELLIVLFIGGPDQQTLPRLIFSGASEGMSPSVAAAAVVVVAVSAIFMIIVETLRRRVARLRGEEAPS